MADEADDPFGPFPVPDDCGSPQLIAELLRVLPAPGEHFPARDRAAWLIGAAALFDVLYGFDPEHPIKVLLADRRPRH